MFFFMPAEISAVLTRFSVLLPFCGCSGCSGCSWAIINAAGVKNSAMASAMTSRRIICSPPFVASSSHCVLDVSTAAARALSTLLRAGSGRAAPKRLDFIARSGPTVYEPDPGGVLFLFHWKIFAKAVPARKLASDQWNAVLHHCSGFQRGAVG